jgi:hypothetical protein
LGEPPRFARRRAMRSITFAGFALLTRYGGSATIPLAEGRAFPLAKNIFYIKNNTYDKKYKQLF